MGICYGKKLPKPEEVKNIDGNDDSTGVEAVGNPSSASADIIYKEVKPATEKPKSAAPSKSPYRIWVSSYKESPFRSPFRSSNGTSPANGTPGRFFKRPFPPPSPAKHIQAALAKRFGTAKPIEGPIPEGEELEKPLDKAFGYSKTFNLKYELGQEIGRGHFGHTCLAKIKKGDLKGLAVAVKIISKAKRLSRFASLAKLGKDQRKKVERLVGTILSGRKP